MTVSQFYAPAHWGTGFGVVDASHPSAHRGQDIVGWSAGSAIPSLFAGRVVRKELNHVLGNVVSVKRADGITFGYCHMNSASPLLVGQQVSAGDTVGYLGNTGTASHGNHCHVTAMPDGNDPGVSRVVDPLPYIRAAIGGTTPAGGGGTTIPVPPTIQEDTMPGIEAVKKTQEPGQSVIMLVGDLTAKIVSDFTAKRYLAPGTTYREVDDSFLTFHPQLVTENVAKIAAAVAALLPGGSTSVPTDQAAFAAAVASAVDAALEDNFAGIGKLPSASDIAAAVDAAEKDDFAALGAQLAAIAAQSGRTPADVVALLGKSIANG